MSPLKTLASLAMALPAIGQASAGPGIPITGHSFDFTALYASGLEISTKSPPTPGTMLSAQEINFQQPTITLSDPPPSSGSDPNQDWYISFLEISYLPPAGEALQNGTLTDAPADAHRIVHADSVPTSEARNATLHVWRQTPSLLSYLDSGASSSLLLHVAQVWNNSTTKADMGFARANVDFKVRNETGEYRGDVDANGASVSGGVLSSTSVTSVPTGAPTTTTTGSGAAGPT
ncbi:hypothetical protein GGR54DRAFT_654392 [Hypoxylon sp. NC1633]|nr:hypothetical protein GGR54DRAFT_654392 [Hypoxylon sp. NC1633]